MARNVLSVEAFPVLPGFFELPALHKAPKVVVLPWRNCECVDELRWYGTVIHVHRWHGKLAQRLQYSTGKMCISRVLNRGALVEANMGMEPASGTFRISLTDADLSVVKLQDCKATTSPSTGERTSAHDPVEVRPDAGIFTAASSSFNATAPGQKNMQFRASRVATLLAANRMLRKLTLAEAYEDEVLEDVANDRIDMVLDWIVRRTRELAEMA